MIINSRFAVASYFGKDPLDLLATPSNLSSEQLQEYNTFISSVDNIIASQDLDTGLIPNFFKTDGLPDQFSGLKTLETGISYYFIMNATANYPVTIPAIGGLSDIGGSTDNVCEVAETPKISFPASSFTLEDSGENYLYMTITFSNLIPNTRYKYVISSAGSNWPVKVLPSEGIIVAQESSQTITPYIMFAPTLDPRDCPGCFSNYTLDPDYKEVHGKNNLYCNLQVAISAEPYDICPATIQQVPIRCKSCLPIREDKYALIHFSEGPVLNLGAQCAEKSYPITALVTEAERGAAYTYKFSLDNNLSTISPSSGIAGFGDGAGSITSLLNVNNVSPVIVKIEIVSENGAKTSTDFMTVECAECQ